MGEAAQTIIIIALLIILSPVILTAAYFVLLFVIGIFASILGGAMVFILWLCGCLDEPKS